MSYHIGLVEEHENLNQLFTFYLNNEGWKVSVYKKGEATITMPDHLDLWIVDITVPNTSAYPFIQELQAAGHKIPVIFISDHDYILEQIQSLGISGVTCLAKPFLPRDLVIHIRQLLGIDVRSCS